MSRIGKKPIHIPKGTVITRKDDRIQVKGLKGTLYVAILEGIDIEITEKEVRVINHDEKDNRSRAKHGLIRSLLANAVLGVCEGFVKRLELHGVGYKAEVKNKGLELNIGYSHPVFMPFPEGITAEVDKSTNVITIFGYDKQRLGQYCADVRAKRPPEPYKGKGFRYEGEYVRRKSGKTI